MLGCFNIIYLCHVAWLFYEVNSLQLTIVYYFSLAGVSLFALSMYLLRVEVWPAPEKPASSILFSLLGNIWLFANLALSLHLSLTSPYTLFFHGILWRLSALFIFLVGLIVLFWSFAVFGEVGRLFGVKIDVLVTAGPYKYVRHPQYFSIILMTITLTILFDTLQMGFSLHRLTNAYVSFGVH